jgi:hypothetical protein
MDSIISEGSYRTTMGEVYKSKAYTAGRRMVGML